MSDQVAVMSLKYPAVQKMRGLRPDWPVGVLAATGIGELPKLEGDFLAVNMAMAGPRLVRRARAEDKMLFVWTVNDVFAMSSMISLGVDGLITDHPGLAKEVIAAHATLSPYERIALLVAERLGLTRPLFEEGAVEQ